MIEFFVRRIYTFRIMISMNLSLYNEYRVDIYFVEMSYLRFFDKNKLFLGNISCITLNV